MTGTADDDVDPLRVRKPPPGLSRAERRVWREAEAARVAEVKDQARGGGFRAVMATAPPRGLGRAGRRVWRDADRDNRSRRMQADVGSESDRYVGALVLMVCIGIVIALRLMFSGSGEQPAPAPAPTAVVSTHPTPPPVLRGE